MKKTVIIDGKQYVLDITEEQEQQISKQNFDYTEKVKQFLTACDVKFLDGEGKLFALGNSNSAPSIGRYQVSYHDEVIATIGNYSKDLNMEKACQAFEEFIGSNEFDKCKFKREFSHYFTIGTKLITRNDFPYNNDWVDSYNEMISSLRRMIF